MNWTTPGSNTPFPLEVGLISPEGREDDTDRVWEEFDQDTVFYLSFFLSFSYFCYPYLYHFITQSTI
jgi:hypothetical protein